MQHITGPVLVLGASGQTGQRVVEALRSRAIPVRALVRSNEQAHALTAPGVTTIVGDVQRDADLREALNEVEAVISALGVRALDDLQQIEAIEHTTIARLIAAADGAGVQQIVLCSSMGTETPEALPALANVLRAKRRAEQALEASGIPYTVVRPGGLHNDPGGEVLVQRSIPGFGRISRADVAEVLVQALLQPAARNTIVEIINQPGAGGLDRPDLFG